MGLETQKGNFPAHELLKKILIKILLNLLEQQKHSVNCINTLFEDFQRVSAICHNATPDHNDITRW